MLKSLLKYLVLGAVLSFFVISPFAANTKAASNAAGLTVSPVIDEFKVEPGQTITRTVRVINPITETVTLYPVVYNFTTDNEDGKPTFYTTKEKSSSYALSEWVKFDRPYIRIAPGEDEQFEITVTAPSTAEPGGHYGAILFSTEEPTQQANSNQVSVVGLIGTLLLATVPGATTEKLVLEEFDAPNILFSPPANFSLLFDNQGNLHVKPQGEIKIRNWFGNVTKTLTVNEAKGNVLPDSKRRFNNDWSFDWKAFGKYTATAVITYGSPEQQISMTRTFVVIPWWFVITIAAIIVLLIIWLIVKKMRRRKVRPTANFIPPKAIAKPVVNRPITQDAPPQEKKKFVMR